MSFVATPDSTRPYFPMLLANGRDAVLIDYSGSMMTGEPDHAHHEQNQGVLKGWYKVAHRVKRQEPILPVVQTGYHFVRDGERHEPDHFRQSFDPATAILTTTLSASGFHYRVETFVTADSVLVEQFEIHEVPPGETALEFFISEPSTGLYPMRLPVKPRTSMRADKKGGVIEYTYGLREVTGTGFLWSDRAPDRVSDHALHITGLKAGDRVTKFVMMVDGTDGVPSLAAARRRFKQLAARTARQLRTKHEKEWTEYSGKSAVQLPDEELQYLYELSTYTLRAHLHPGTGGTTVGMFPPLWGGGGVFGYDSYYLQQALLRTNHVKESGKMIGFWKLCGRHGRRMAKDIGMPGIFFPWWIFTMLGDTNGMPRKNWLEEKRLDTCVIALQVLRHFESTGDTKELAAHWGLVKGCLDFLLAETLLVIDDEAVIAEGQGSNESLAVTNDTLTAMVTIKTLELAISVAPRIGKKVPGSYADALQKLRKGLAGNYKDGVLMAYRGAEQPGVFPLTAGLYNVPQGVDRRSAMAALKQIRSPWGLDTGFPTEVYKDWPWFHFRAAIALAYLGSDKAASYVRSGTRCNSSLGAFPEKVRIDGYGIGYWYSSPHALLAFALTALLVNDAKGAINVFPHIPASWKDVHFRDLRVPPGLLVSATMKKGKVTEVIVKNDSDELVEFSIRIPSRHLARRSRKKEIFFPLRLLPGRKKVVKL